MFIIYNLLYYYIHLLKLFQYIFRVDLILIYIETFMFQLLYIYMNELTEP